MKKQFAFLFIFTALFLGTVTTVSAATSGAVTYSINHAVKAGDRLTITATFSAPLLDTPPVKITIFGGDDNGGASTMTKVDDTHYVYTHTVSGATSGNATVEFSNGIDIYGNAVIATPTSGGMYIVDNYINPFLKTGTVTAVGGTIVAGKWNSTNTSVNVTVPIDNDSTLVGGLLQLLAGVGGSSQYVGNNYTLQSSDINGNKILSITDAQLEGVDSFADNASVHFIAKITDSAGNTTTGTASATLLTVDQTVPTATVSYDKTTSTNSDVVATITPSESVTVTNNNGSFSHTFTTNGVFTFNFTDNAGNTNVATASVGNITDVQPVPASCTSWTYSDWSSCSTSGTQTRTAISSSPNSCTGGSPIVSQSCIYVPPTVACTVNDWVCSGWNSCPASGSQARACNKISNCQGGVASPAISQNCTPVPQQATSTPQVTPPVSTVAPSYPIDLHQDLVRTTEDLKNQAVPLEEKPATSPDVKAPKTNDKSIAGASSSDERASLERDISKLNTQIKKIPEIKNAQNETKENVSTIIESELKDKPVQDNNVATSREDVKLKSLWVRIIKWFGF